MSAVDSYGRPAVTTLLKRQGKRRLLLSVNATPCCVRARLDIGSSGMVSARDEGRYLKADGGLFDDDFKPLAVHVYEMEGADD